MFWIAFDVGGTFVDLVAIDLATTNLFATKVPSSPTDAAGSVARGVRALLELAGARAGDVSRVVHGTTMATNALIERKGARVGMITTAGFRDVVHIGRMLRDELFDVMFESTPPLAERDVRLEVDERVSPEGLIQRALNMEQTEKVIDDLVRSEVAAVAVCLLHSYANPSHEIAIGEAVARAYPALPVSLSHRLSMEYSEYERWTTTVVNAYLMPRVTTYLRDLASRLAALGIPAPVEIVQSNGGIIPLDIAARFPVRLLASGPAGGVAGAARFAKSAGVDSIITFDMGGTSTDVCVVRDGRPQLSTERKIDGYPIRAVMSDVHSIGAGGGSIATVDASGTLRVGPESAGASPGPVAYGAGGSEPTVTDADLALGYLNPARYCAGRQTIDAARAVDAIRRRIAERTTVSVSQAAQGIVDVAVNNMVGAVRQITTQRGFDPRDFVLVAYGGAGPVHAGLVAREMNIPTVLVPAYPGLLSAQGMLFSDYQTDLSRTVARTLETIGPDELTAICEDLAGQCSALLSSALGPEGRVSVERLAEMCYDGQKHEIPVPIPPGRLERADLAALAESLDAEFQRLYGFLPSSHVPKLVNVRVFVRGRTTETERLSRITVREHSVVEVPAVSYRAMYFPEFGGTSRDCPVYDRTQLQPASRVGGPCVIEEDYSTVVIQPGQEAEVDEQGNVFIHVTPGPHEDDARQKLTGLAR